LYQYKPLPAPTLLQTRNYIFLPSSFSDIAEALRTTFPSLRIILKSPKHRRNLKLQLREWVRIKVSPLSLPLNEQPLVQKFQSKIVRARHHVQKTWEDYLQSSHLKSNTKLVRWWERRKQRGNIQSLVSPKSKRFLKNSLLKSHIPRFPKFHKSRTSILSPRKYIQHQYRLQWKHYREIWKQKTAIIQEPTLNDWFDKDGYPITSRHWLTQRFVNPWQSESSDGNHSLQQVWKWRFQRIVNQYKEAREYYAQKRIKSQLSMEDVVGPSTIITQDYSPSQNDKIRLTWIGHSTCLVSMQGFTILTDPIFSERASPIQFSGVGVGRSKPPSTPISQLLDSNDKIDAVLISHDHYDHLDYDSVMQLHKSNKVKYWVVPKGIKQWLMDNCEISQRNIVELEWWEKAHFQRNRPNLHIIDDFQLDQNQNDIMTITCAPTHHWCCRTPFDRNKRLWCSFAVQTTPSSTTLSPSSPLRFYFGGDTALPRTFPLHRQIGDRLGPFDLAALPIGAYEPQYFMRHSHCNPQEAVQIHKDIRAKKSVGIHWGTFPLAEEGLNEPAAELKRVLERHSKREDFSVIGVGSHVESEGQEKDTEEIEISGVLESDDEEFKYG